MKRQILVVDDYEVNRKILSRILESEYDVLTASTGAEACRCLIFVEQEFQLFFWI